MFRDDPEKSPRNKTLRRTKFNSAPPLPVLNHSGPLSSLLHPYDAIHRMSGLDYHDAEVMDQAPDFWSGCPLLSPTQCPDPVHQICSTGTAGKTICPEQCEARCSLKLLGRWCLALTTTQRLTMPGFANSGQAVRVCRRNAHHRLQWTTPRGPCCMQ